jgi:TRAP-type C4-dicarboxylate transport system permease small subunit
MPRADRLFSLLAVLGGAAMIGAGLLVCASVIGRALFDAPIDGDFEFVKLAMGFAGFAVLPLTEARGGHVAAETFTEKLSAPWQARIAAFWHLVQAIALGALAYAMAAGALATRASGETTMQREIPLWPGVALASLLLVCAVGASVLRARALLRGNTAP